MSAVVKLESVRLRLPPFDTYFRRSGQVMCSRFRTIGSSTPRTQRSELNPALVPGLTSIAARAEVLHMCLSNHEVE